MINGKRCPLEESAQLQAKYIIQQIKLWDNSYTIIQKAIRDILDGDTVTYSSNSSDNPSLPVARAETSLTLFGNPPVYLIIFGGHSPNDDGIYQFLNDMWTFSLYSERWTQIFPNKHIPPKRSGHVIFVNVLRRALK